MEQRGFTLIALVVVIVILGILAATALPKFIDLSGDAKSAAAQGIAGALSSGTQVNYAARKANTASGVTIANCTDASNAMQQFPSGAAINSAAIAANAVVTCTVTYSGTTALFAAIGI